MEKAAVQGHAYAMTLLGVFHNTRDGHEQAVGWFTKGSEAGLPRAMFNLGNMLRMGKGVAAPDSPAAADWYRRAGDAGVGQASSNLAAMYSVGCGKA